MNIFLHLKGNSLFISRIIIIFLQHAMPPHTHSTRPPQHLVSFCAGVPRQILLEETGTQTDLEEDRLGVSRATEEPTIEFALLNRKRARH